MPNTPKKSPTNSKSPKEGQIKLSRNFILILLSVAALTALIFAKRCGCDEEREQVTANKPTPDDVSAKTSGIATDSDSMNTKRKEKLKKLSFVIKGLQHRMKNQEESDAGPPLSEEYKQMIEEIGEYLMMVISEDESAYGVEDGEIVDEEIFDKKSVELLKDRSAESKEVTKELGISEPNTIREIERLYVTGYDLEAIEPLTMTAIFKHTASGTTSLLRLKERIAVPYDYQISGINDNDITAEAIENMYGHFNNQAE